MKKIIFIFMMLSSILIMSCGQKTSGDSAAADTNQAAMDHSAHSAHNTVGSEIINLMHAPMMEQRSYIIF